MNNDMKKALDNYIEKIKEDYKKWLKEHTELIPIKTAPEKRLEDTKRI